MYVDDIELAGKKQNIDPTWKVLNKEVDLGEPTSFFYHVYLGCTQRSNQGFQPGLRKIARNRSHGETLCRNHIFVVL